MIKYVLQILIGSVLIIGFVAFQDYLLVNEIRAERQQEISELEGKVKALQSRVKFNATMIDDVVVK